ncbi:50S ribosomal protein L23 [Eubacteriales bacterium OttesenSCG-928-M02]|nr:50S ribosomal protein L23 [Eubacteriales bacterium OttesenSCG-928-M02]
MKSPYDIIIKPVLTEKSYDGLADKKYAFYVHPDCNKTEVKMAVEAAFGVKVEKVNIMNQLGKIKRQGYTSGRRASTRKAYVQLKSDSDPIAFFDGMY